MGAPFRKLAELYSRLGQTSSYLSKRRELSAFFKSVGRGDIRAAAYLSLGTIGAKYEDTDLGIAEKMALRAVSDAYNADESRVKSLLGKSGDLGDACFALNRRRKSALTIGKVYGTLLGIRDASGDKSQAKKRFLLSFLLKNSTASESRYIMRIVLGRLRIGIGEQAILDSLAHAFGRPKAELEASYNARADLGSLAESLSRGEFSGSRIPKASRISLFRPVRSMLAQRVKTVSEIRSKFSGDVFAAEEKYDGERIQIHKRGDEVRAFSRRLNEITSQYPEIMESARRGITARNVILDGEVVAYKGGKILPFQSLMQRRRKYRVDEYARMVPAAVFLFDILYLNGKSLLAEPYPVRRALLEKALKPSGRIMPARRVVSGDFGKIRKFFRASIGKGLEGIIVKSTSKDSVYSPGKRGFSWIKWKREYAEGMGDTFDLVVVGSYPGKGRRKGHFGALLCAAYNRPKRRFETFTRVGSGYKDEDFGNLEKMLKKLEVRGKPRNVSISASMEPQAYYRPALVVEVLGSQITHSPAHTLGMSRGKGLALRFPRFLRVRTDKRAADATTLGEILGMVENAK